MGLGFEFLRHIERTRVIIHIVDISGTEGRDPVDDINKINEELKTYDPDILNKPQVIAANKTDCLDKESLDEALEELQKAFPDSEIFPISAAVGDGIKPLLYKVKEILDGMPKDAVVFEPEVDTDTLFDNPDEPFYVSKEKDGVFCVTGPRVERMLGYTNIESEKGFLFFQQFMEKNHIIKELKKLGLTEGDTVKVGEYLEFEYFEGIEE